jgi:predicted transposase YbfD/YdcC
VDGKAVRSAPGNTFGGCLHLVSARAAESRPSLGQAAVADGSHEIAAVPELLEVLDLHGALATLDAAGCQRGVARQVRGQGGDYLLAVKGNQPNLRDAVRAVFDRACEAEFAGVKHDGREDVGGGHGRHEGRYTAVIYDPDGLPPEWPDVAAVVKGGQTRSAQESLMQHI